jgi:hypothetical protein
VKELGRGRWHWGRWASGWILFCGFMGVRRLGRACVVCGVRGQGLCGPEDVDPNDD